MKEKLKNILTELGIEFESKVYDLSDLEHQDSDVKISEIIHLKSDKNNCAIQFDDNKYLRFETWEK